METNFVYMTEDQIEKRRAQIASIEGLAEIKAATAAWVKYHQAKMEVERGDRDYDDMPDYNPDELGELKQKYPRAAAFLEAESWTYFSTPIKVRLGSRAMEKILDGEDPAAVLEEMSQGLDAFNMAQEEG